MSARILEFPSGHERQQLDSMDRAAAHLSAQGAPSIMELTKHVRAVVSRQRARTNAKDMK